MARGVVPATKHRLHRAEKLLPRVVRRGSSGRLPGDVLEVGGHCLQLLCRKLVVQLHASAGFVSCQALLEWLRGHFLHHFGVYLDEAAIGVPRRSPVAHHRAQPLDDFVVDAQIEDGVHHAGHGNAGAGAHRHQQRIGGRAKLVADGLFQFGDALADGPGQPLGQRIPTGQIVAADLRGDNEPRRHRQSQLCHLAQIASLAAKKVCHRGVAFAEPVDQFCCLSLNNHGQELPSIRSILPVTKPTKSHSPGKTSLPIIPDHARRAKLRLR